MSSDRSKILDLFRSPQFLYIRICTIGNEKAHFIVLLRILLFFFNFQRFAFFTPFYFFVRLSFSFYSCTGLFDRLSQTQELTNFAWCSECISWNRWIRSVFRWLPKHSSDWVRVSRSFSRGWLTVYMSACHSVETRTDWTPGKKIVEHRRKNTGKALRLTTTATTTLPMLVDRMLFTVLDFAVCIVRCCCFFFLQWWWVFVCADCVWARVCVRVVVVSVAHSFPSKHAHSYSSAHRHSYRSYAAFNNCELLWIRIRAAHPQQHYTHTAKHSLAYPALCMSSDLIQNWLTDHCRLVCNMHTATNCRPQHSKSCINCFLCLSIYDALQNKKNRRRATQRIPIFIRLQCPFVSVMWLQAI